MNKTLFWRSTGIGIGVGLSVALAYVLVDHRFDQPAISLSSLDRYQTLQQIANANTIPMKDPSAGAVGNQNPLDQAETCTEYETLDHVRDPSTSDSCLQTEPAIQAYETISIDAESSYIGSATSDPIASETNESRLNDRLVSSPSRISPIQDRGIQVNPFFDSSKLDFQESSRSTSRDRNPRVDLGREDYAVKIDNNQRPQIKPVSENSYSPMDTILTEPIRLEKSQQSPQMATHSATSVLSSVQRLHTLPVLELSEPLAVRAVQHIEYGKTLARRAATATAKQEFLAALTLLAQDFDSRGQTSEYSNSLRRGLLALKEADDFVISDVESQIGLNVAQICESHQSGALARDQAQPLTIIQALQRYLMFAQTEIEIGAGLNVVSAEALYCLGKLHTLDQISGPVDSKTDMARAIVFHRASLNCDPNNFRSANELGVLLARLGELEASKKMFRQSLTIHPTAKTWENLAKLHQRMNEPQLAQLAQVEYQRSLEQQNYGMIRWVDAPQFQTFSVPENPAPSLVENGRNLKNSVDVSQPVRQASVDRIPDAGEKKSWAERLKIW